MDGERFRIGNGYDIHPLVEGRPLILGGVRIESDLGLAGHSDADALIHAICDAILGAMALGDLGRHFPETEEYKDISSIVLLERVRGIMEAEGYRLVNVDSIIHAESPAMSPHREKMIENIADALGVETDSISVKATRGEAMGPVGERRAIAASAVVLIEKASGTQSDGID
jgi:2-C-methyl-D-erythritol 2,4-cyclodiphosphate synthase